MTRPDDVPPAAMIGADDGGRGRSALDSVRQLGAFFAVETGPLEGRWRPAVELVDGGPALGERIDATAAALASMLGGTVAAIDARAAMSLAHLNLVARLLAPPLATASVAAYVPLFALEDLRWQPVLGGPAPLAYVPSAEADGGMGDLVAAFVERVLDPAVVRLTDAVATLARSRGGISEHVLRGNVASALVTATRLIGETGGAPAAHRAVALRDGLLATSWLAETFDVDRSRRRSCCLYYRAVQTLAGIEGASSLCGDCVLQN